MVESVSGRCGRGLGNMGHTIAVEVDAEQRGGLGARGNASESARIGQIG